MAETPCSDFVRADETPGDQYCECGRTLEEHDTAALPPPATDPQGWVPLVRGGKLPEKDSYPLVTLLDETLGQRRTLSAHYLPNSFAVGSRVYLGPDFDTFVYAAGHNGTHKGLRLLAWRPAPAPYRGGV